jgi:UTP-glucose-1-phosphate uridylyltransferase
MHDSCSLLILAAGLGSRFGADKQIVALSSLSLPIFGFSLQDAVKNNITHAIIVTRSTLANFFEKNIFPCFPAIHFDLVFQDQSLPSLPMGRLKPWGTGHAVLCAKDYISHYFIVINADDFYGQNAITIAANFLKSTFPNQYCCVGYPLIHTLSPNGPVSRGIIESDSQNFVTSITEMAHIEQGSNGTITAHKISEKTKSSRHSSFSSITLQPQQPVSLNLFGLNSNIFPILEEKFQNFLKENDHSPTTEFYLPTTITAPDILNKIMTMKMLSTQDHWLGITYRDDLLFVENHLETLIAQGIYR